MAPDIPDDRLDELIAEATLDAYDEDEQRAAFAAVLQDNLQVPFETTVLGVRVRVTGVTDSPGTGIAAICRGGKHRQLIGILDLPLPEPPPAGAEWIAAYRRWGG
ncbi:hypothetical protein GCM10009555_034250 [Acrocarpospora macrocephala]|uniref:Calcium binding n=1 Tax=Acrocarpospora macrocephala TaxID=150177 RepID=A0A5M3WCN3_9ACTN|nr:hypothetical protein [Acrocarpospora macrocephala]GES06606.1 hypothetical protein Amac_002010 [Acrocarpospora macrocephala]